VVLVDKADVGERLAADLAAYQRPEFDAPRFDGGTWLWLGYLANQMRRGEMWLVRYGLMTAELYDWALPQWAERTGQRRPDMPLAPALMAKISSPGG
jgi:hypothetical protein